MIGAGNYYNMRKKMSKYCGKKKYKDKHYSKKPLIMRINIDTPTEKSTKDKLSSQELLEFINVKLIGTLIWPETHLF